MRMHACVPYIHTVKDVVSEGAGWDAKCGDEKYTGFGCGWIWKEEEGGRRRWMVLNILGFSMPSMDDNMYASNLIASTTTYGPNQLGLNLPLVTSFVFILLMFYFRTRSPTLNSFDLIFLPNARLSLAW